MILAWAQAGFSQVNNSRIITSAGMPARLSMNVTVARQQQATQADSTARNPLYEGAGSSGHNPMFENRLQPAAPGSRPVKNGENPMPAEKRYSSLKDVVRTQV